jgi:hypothetical protein
MSSLTAEDVLRAPTEYDHVTEVRSVGPAILLVLERDGPLRMEIAASTEGAYLALLDEVAANPKWSELLALFDNLRADEEDTWVADLQRRDTRWRNRLERGRRIECDRVTNER